MNEWINMKFSISMLARDIKDIRRHQEEFKEIWRKGDSREIAISWTEVARYASIWPEIAIQVYGYIYLDHYGSRGNL